MFPIRFKRPALLCMAMLTVVLSGCGLIQKVVDESKSVASAVFYKQIKILHLDFFSRSALNTDAEDTRIMTPCLCRKRRRWRRTYWQNTPSG